MTAVRWAVRGLGVVLALVALVYGIGMLLPVEHRVSVERTVAGSAEAVWRAIADVEGSAAWRSDVERVETLDEGSGRTVWREWGPEGPITFELVEARRPGTRVTRIADEELPFGGAWRYELRGGTDSTTVTITEEGEVYDPLFRFFARFVFGHAGTATRYLDDLEAFMAERVAERIGAAREISHSSRPGGRGPVASGRRTRS